MKNLSLMPNGYGHFTVTITYYGKTYSAITNNTRATDAYQFEEGAFRMTQRQASQILFNEVKKSNNLS
jgi:hypothetical protein